MSTPENRPRESGCRMVTTGRIADPGPYLQALCCQYKLSIQDRKITPHQPSTDLSPKLQDEMLARLDSTVRIWRSGYKRERIDSLLEFINQPVKFATLQTILTRSCVRATFSSKIFARASSSSSRGKCLATALAAAHPSTTNSMPSCRTPAIEA